MKARLVFTLAVVGGLLLGSGSAFAHHGTAISYDNDKLVTVKGNVTEFVWANPHGQLHWDVKGPDGKVVAWGGELHSIALMTRDGWNKNIVKAGDEVTVTGHPSKFGTPYMVVTTIVLNGKEYFRDAPQN